MPVIIYAKELGEIIEIYTLICNLKHIQGRSKKKITPDSLSKMVPNNPYLLILTHWGNLLS